MNIHTFGYCMQTTATQNSLCTVATPRITVDQLLLKTRLVYGNRMYLVFQSSWWLVILVRDCALVHMLVKLGALQQRASETCIPPWAAMDGLEHSRTACQN